MTDSIDHALPGADLVRAGLDDVRRGRESVEGLLVLVGAPRLRRIGIDVPGGAVNQRGASLGHATDLEDVEQMIGRDLVDPGRLLGFFHAIEPELLRYPAIDPPSFRRAVEAVVARKLT